MGKKTIKVNVPYEVGEAYKKIKDSIDYPKLLHDKYAMEEFLKEKQKINLALSIESHSSIAYIKRDSNLKVYLNDDIIEELNKAAKEYGLTRNTLMIQAIMNYCNKMGEKIGQEFSWNF